MSYNYLPYVGINDISFGNSFEQVHSKLGEPVDEFYRGWLKHVLTDMYQDFMVYYSDKKVVEAIEFYGDIDVNIGDMVIGDKTFDLILQEFLKRDNELIIDGDGFTSIKYGLGVYCPSWKDSEDLLIESVIVFRKGYYD